MIMDENNFRMYNEEVISNKCNCSIVARNGGPNLLHEKG